MFLLYYLFFLYVIYKLLKYYSLTKSITRNLRRYGQLLTHTGYFAEFLYATLRIFSNRICVFYEKYSKFADSEQDIYAVTSIWPQTVLTYNIADAAIIKNIIASRALFPKPASRYQVISFLGRNIVASEGEEWKRFRKICAPAFNTKNNRMVWEETKCVLVDIFENMWGNEKHIVLDNAADITLSISLYVISSVGFGKKEFWHRKDDNDVPNYHQMTFKQCMRVIVNDIFLRAALPKWVVKLGPTKRIRILRDAIEDLKKYLSEIIQDGKKNRKVEKHDLLSNLINATFREDESQFNSMTEEELIGNIFIFMIGGHETTTHSLAFTFAILALYPDVQEKVYQELKTLCDGRAPTYDDIPRLVYTIAVFYEVLRMIPPVPAIPKLAAGHTTFKADNIHGIAQEISVPKDSDLIISVAGVHYNPKYWDEPDQFRPERFLENWPRYAFIPFSAGARVCLGQKFSETEVLSVLSFVCPRYKITLRDNPIGETFEEKKARVLALSVGLSVKPTGVPLVFQKRD